MEGEAMGTHTPNERCHGVGVILQVNEAWVLLQVAPDGGELWVGGWGVGGVRGGKEKSVVPAWQWRPNGWHPTPWLRLRLLVVCLWVGGGWGRWVVGVVGAHTAGLKEARGSGPGEFWR